LKNYFVLDFYCQTESGLKKDIKESGVVNIDPWEDMEEDNNFIHSYLLPKIDIKPIEHILFKCKTKYILRLLCESLMDIETYLAKNKIAISDLVKSGWSPYSLKGIPFKCVQIIGMRDWNNLKENPVELTESYKTIGHIYSFK
jgi:hypothetical protein